MYKCNYLVKLIFIIYVILLGLPENKFLNNINYNNLFILLLVYLELIFFFNKIIEILSNIVS
jgi:hypothetical protein